MSTEKILIGGRALNALGSSRLTKDTDYLVNDTATTEAFIRDEASNTDYINANGHKLFAAIWATEQGRQIASPQALLELKAYAFVQHCLNGFWQKADDAEYDMKFLVRTFGLKGVSLVKAHVSAGELTEINKVIASTRI